MESTTHHVVPTRNYVTIFLILMVLTATTVAVTFVDLGPLNLIIALAIAVTKATLVVLFFMHVKYSSALTKLFIISALIMCGILVLLTGADYISRNWLPQPEQWEANQ